MRLLLTLYQGKSGFQSLLDEWERFACRYASNFVHFPAWYGAELERSGDDGVYFLAVRDSHAELVAVLPLQHRHMSVKGMGVPVVQLYYANEMGVNDVLSREPLRPLWPTISAYLREKLPFFLFMRWNCVLENGCAATIPAHPDEMRPTHLSKFLSFPDGWQSFLSGYTAQFRSAFAKKLRRIGKLAPLRLELSSTAPALESGFEHFLRVEDSGWKGREGTSIAKQPSAERYYRHLLQHFSRLGLCRVGVLWLGEEVIAANFGIEVAGCLYLLKIGFCEDYGRYSPGSLLLYHLIKHHCEQTSVRSLSFVTGVDWIDRWHPSAVRAGVFYTDADNRLSKLAVRLLRWGVSVRQARAAELAVGRVA